MEVVIQQLRDQLAIKQAELVECQQKTSTLTKEINRILSTLAHLEEQDIPSTQTIPPTTQTNQTTPPPTPTTVPSIPTTVTAIPKHHEKDTKFYVIYNGPMAGIYDEWHQAAIHITGKKGIIHKSFPTRNEAEKALADHQNPPLRPQYKTALTTPAPSQASSSSTRLNVLGKIPNTSSASIDLERINSLPMKDTTTIIHEGAKFITSTAFCDCFQALNEWTEEMKVFQYYPQNRGRFGPKAVVLPGAEPLTTYLLFQSGLIDTLYLQNMDILADFPVGFIQAIKAYKDRFAKDREIYIKFYSSYPIFEVKEPAQEASILVPKIAYVQVGISNGTCPPIEPPSRHQFSWDLINQFNLNCIEGILIQCQRITNDTLLRVNYKGHNMIMVSTYKAPITTEAIHTLQAFMEPFTHMTGVFANLTDAWKYAICKQLNEWAVHSCPLCQVQESEDASIIEE